MDYDADGDRNDEAILPLAGDRILREGSRAGVWDCAAGDRWGYALGYKQAADAIVESVETADNGFADLMVYPAAFLYRQYLELALKEIDTLAAVYLGESEPPRRSHGLMPLLERLERAIKVSGSELSVEHRAASRVVGDWDSLDGGSTAFRYARHANGDVTIPDLPFVGLRTLAAVMGRLSGFLYGARTSLEESLNAKHEAMGEYDP